MSKLGIIAGAGALPGQVIAACREIGRDFFVLAFEGSAERAVIGDAPVDWIKMSSISTALAGARREGIKDLVLVGKIPRPSLLELMKDVRSARFVAKVGTRMLGDDTILSAVVRELEEAEGFNVVGPEEILQDLLATSGYYGKLIPTDDDLSDIRRCMEVVREIGRLDIGQAAIVQNGFVIGVEGAEGTDRMIARCAEFVSSDLPGGVLVKAAKPNQNPRIDLPAVGPSTVKCVADAGLRGIAIEAGRTLVVERTEMVRVADAAGIYLFGATPDS
ncbi:MAG: hypothetical protein CFH41_00475 [Alphaproteobacteria bacterium MarineAlpha11_Bin1]|nr:MAG: hypothetical protein CFH41_00475 [Alphaproteobacteria bacterium MarineAlpha11_Bin1]